MSATPSAQPEDQTPPTSTGQPSRRTVAKALAWSVPVVALATTVPAAVASPVPNPTVLRACRLDPADAACAEIYDLFPQAEVGKTFVLAYPLTNNSTRTIVLKPSTSFVSSGVSFTVVGAVPDYCTPIAPGESILQTYYVVSDHDPATPVSLGIQLPWGHDCADTDHAPIMIPSELIPSFPSCATGCAPSA